MSLKKNAKQIQKVGAKNSNGDTMLAHINPQEGALLQMFGGSGRTDPNTGIKHYDYGAGGGDGGGEGFGGDGGFGNGFGGGFGAGMGGMSGGEGAGLGGLGGFGDGGASSIGSSGDTFSNALNGDTSFDNGLGMEGFGSGLGTGVSSGLGEATNSLSQAPENNWGRRALNAILGMTPMSPMAKMGLNMGQTALSTNPQAPANFMGNTALGLGAAAIGGFPGMALGAIGGAMGLGNSIGGMLGKGNPAGNGTSNGTASNGGGLGDVLSGIYGLYKGNEANQQTKTLSGLYGQNSSYAQAMRQQLDRRDAAAGRRSQYGPREVELQARLADQYGRNAPTMMAMQNRSDAIRAQAIAMLGKGLNQYGPSLSSMFNNPGSSWAPAQSSATLGSLYGGSSYGDNGWSSGSNDGFISDPMMGP